VTQTVVVGADVGGTNVKYTLLDPAGRMMAQGDIPTDPRDPAGTVARLAEATRSYIGEGDLVGVGLACAGIVTADTGLLGRAPNLPGWEDSDLAGAVKAAYGPVAVAVANDVNAALYGESRYGAGRSCRHLVMIAMGTGVGGGVMVDGDLVTGFAEGAGEIGHMTLQLDGPTCPCGNRGCLEAFCGSVGMVRRARELAALSEASEAWRAMAVDHGDGLTTRHCFELAAAGDATAVRFFAEVGRRLGQATASLVNILAPERVIIGGGVAQAGDLVLQPCRDMVAHHVLSAEGRSTPVVPAELGPHAASMGAAGLALAVGEAR